MCASRVKDDNRATLSWEREVSCFICQLPGLPLEGFKCPLCNRWLHLKCAGVNVRVFNEEYRGNPSYLWICVPCLPKIAIQTPIVDIRSDPRLGAPICITACPNQKNTASFLSSIDSIPAMGNQKSTGESSDSGTLLSQPSRPSGQPILSTNETDLAVWWDSESGSEPSFGRAVSEVLSRFCWVFCCPPCPPCITRKIAFHPPRPPTYKIRVSESGTPEMEILDETLKISSPLEMKGEVVVLHEKPKFCNGRLKRLVAMQWLHPPQPTKSNMIILHSHVNAADLGSLHFAMEILARRTGCDVVAYDYAGYGGSDGTPGEEVILQNADTVMRYITEVLRRPLTNVILYGQSIGSVPTWYLASKYDVAGVIQLSGLHSGWRTLCRRRQSSAPFGCCCLNPFNNANLVKHVRAPVLLIHGTEDEVIQFSQALEMRRLCGGLAVEPLWAEGLGHMGIERTRVFYQRILRFIHEEVRHFTGTPPTVSTLTSDSSFSSFNQQQYQNPEAVGAKSASLPAPFPRKSTVAAAAIVAEGRTASVTASSVTRTGPAKSQSNEIGVLSSKIKASHTPTEAHSIATKARMVAKN